MTWRVGSTVSAARRTSRDSDRNGKAAWETGVGTRRYILRKVLQALLTLAFVMVFNFFLFRVIPSDFAGAAAPRHDRDQPNQRRAVDPRPRPGQKPLPQQFLIYAQDTLMLN